MAAKKIIQSLLACVLFASQPMAGFGSSEVLEDTGTKVVVRELPGSRKPYAVITSRNSAGEEIPPQPAGTRPDYRMLDPKVKNGEISYDGPFSSRKKVYLFAAGLAVTGAVSSVALPVAAVSGTGAAGGAGAYGAAGGAVAAGTLSTAWLKSRPDDQDNFKLESRSRVIKMPSHTEQTPQEPPPEAQSEKKPL